MPPTFRQVINETIQFAKEFASDFKCSKVKGDYDPRSPRFALCFKSRDNRSRDDFLDRVCSRNHLLLVFLLPDPDPNLTYPNPEKARNHWRAVLEIDPNHPFFRGFRLDS